VIIIVPIIGGVVDEPAPVDEMQFGSPNVVAVVPPGRRAPDANA
jgi:hypothetical protein